jgi:hypothetical protein
MLAFERFLAIADEESLNPRPRNDWKAGASPTAGEGGAQ